MKNKIIFYCLAFIVILTLCGCKQNKTTEEKNELKYEIDRDAIAEVGDYYKVPIIKFSDSYNNIYIPEKKVIDPEGNETPIENGSIFLSILGNYDISYTVDFLGQEKVEHIIVNSKDTTGPSISFDKETITDIEGSVVSIPTPYVTDNYSKDNNINVSYEVFYDNDIVQTTNNQFELTNNGEYIVIYTATDENNNVSQKSLTINSIEKEEGVIAYFNRSFGTDNLSLMFTGGTLESTNEITLPGDEYSLKISVENVAGGFFINSPYIKDITEYKYMYFYVYTESPNISLTYNAIYSPNGQIEPNKWKKIVLTRMDDGAGIDYANETGDRVFHNYYDGTWPLRPTDITGFNMYIYFGNGYGTVYFSALKVANEFPVGDFEMDSYINPNEEYELPIVSNIENTTQKAYYIFNGAVHEIEGNKVTLTEEGIYKFVFDIYKDNKLIDSVTKEVTCAARELDNITLSDTALALEIATRNADTTLKISENVTFNGEQVLEWGLPWPNVWGYVYYNNLPISNLNAKDSSGEYLYDYVYFYVYSKTISQYGTNNTYATNVETNKWERIVFYRDGENFKVATHDGTQSLFNDEFNATDINGLYLRAFPTTSNNVVYLTTMRACKELPELINPTE